MDEWLNLNEAASILNINRATIYRWSKQGILPIYKMVGKSMVKKADVDKILADIKPLHPKKETLRRLCTNRYLTTIDILKSKPIKVIIIKIKCDIGQSKTKFPSLTREGNAGIVTNGSRDTKRN